MRDDEHTRIALGSWNELGAAGTHHFLCIAASSSSSPRPLDNVSVPHVPRDLSFLRWRWRDGWLRNLEDVWAMTMCRRGAARRGAVRPQPCIRASGVLACRKFRARARCYGVRVPRVWHEVCQIGICAREKERGRKKPRVARHEGSFLFC